MSKIDELIREYCPEGVEFKPLEQVASIKRGRRVTKSDLIIDGAYPVYSGGVTPMGHYDKFNQPANTVTVVKYGTAGFVNYITEEFWANDVCYCIKPKEVLSNKYLFYVLKSQQTLIQSQATDAIPAHLPTDVIGGVRIPVPPLEVQKEIVKILDTFTQLEAELSAELEARKAQYEHYRNQLLTFDDVGGVRWTTLGEVANETFWIMPATPSFSMEGEVPYITSKNIKGGHISFENIKRISRSDFDLISKNRPIVVDDILISMIGTIGEVARVKNSDLEFYGQNMYLVRLNQQEIDVNYFLHFFDSHKMKAYFSSIKNNSGQGYLKANHIESIKVPLPQLTEQKRIAIILDKFENLTTSISEGLPAEIAARRQQYEYYRTKLLTFKELPA